MRLVYLIHSLHGSGGMERVLSVKASWLAEKGGCQVHIVTASLKGRTPFFPLSPKVQVHDLGTGDSFGPALSRYGRALRKLLSELRPDVTISLGGNDIYALAQMEGVGVKLSEFHFSHDKFLVKYGRLPLGRTYASYRIRRFEKAAAAMAALVVLTRADIPDWQSRVPLVRQIYNPVTLPDALPSPLTERRMIAVGRLTSQKNQASMIRAWRMVADRHPDWTLEIYGDGPLRDSLLKQIGELGLGSQVLLKGVCRDIASRMRESSALVLSSAYEGFPLVLVEAAACGLPLLSYDCPKGPAEIIDDGRNGFLTAPGDEAGLADAICRVIEDGQLRRDMGRASLLKAEEFSPDRVMARWLELFNSLVDGK